MKIQAQTFLLLQFQIFLFFSTTHIAGNELFHVQNLCMVGMRGYC